MVRRKPPELRLRLRATNPAPETTPTADTDGGYGLAIRTLEATPSPGQIRGDVRSHSRYKMVWKKITVPNAGTDPFDAPPPVPSMPMILFRSIGTPPLTLTGTAPLATTVTNGTSARRPGHASKLKS